MSIKSHSSHRKTGFQMAISKARQYLLILVFLTSLLGLNTPAIEVAKADAGWTAYNDCAGTFSITNTTTFSITGSNTTKTGLLKNSSTGAVTNVTAAFTSSKTLTSSTSGSETASGTDAYTTFHNHADMKGVIQYNTNESGNWWEDLTLSGLDPGKTYTFATSANRAGTTSSDPPYSQRVTRFTLSGDEGAANASTSGVTEIDAHSVAFATGQNTDTGYVARWTGIQPGSDGTIVIRAQPNVSGTYQVYGFGVFMLQEEVMATPTIIVSGELNDFTSPIGGESATQSYSVSGTNLTAGITITAPEAFEISTSAESGFSSGMTLPESGGTVAATNIYVRFGRDFSQQLQRRHSPLKCRRAGR